MGGSITFHLVCQTNLHHYGEDKPLPERITIKYREEHVLSLLAIISVIAVLGAFFFLYSYMRAAFQDFFWKRKIRNARRESSELPA